jgi:hypothetical protein
MQGLIADYKVIPNKSGSHPGGLGFGALSRYYNSHMAVPIWKKNGGKLKQ